MARLFSVLLMGLAFVSAVGASARAQDYADSENGFRLNVPDGWTVSKTPIKEVALALVSPRFEQTRGNCTIISVDSPETKTVNQDVLNEMLDKTVNETFWKQAIASAKMTNVVIDTTNTEERKGRKIFYVTTHFEAPTANGAPTKFRGRQGLHWVPGRFYIITCLGSDTGYAVEEKSFDSVFASFEPTDAGLIASLRQRTVNLNYPERHVPMPTLNQMMAAGARGVASARR